MTEPERYCVHIGAAGPQALISVQADGQAGPAIDAVLGVPLPAMSGTFLRAAATGMSFDVLQPGPREWLLRLPADLEPALLARLQASVADLHAAVTRLSDAYEVFELRGRDAAAVLALGCPLDLESLLASACARSLLARAPVLIAPLPNSEGFEIWVERSHAPYLRQWLETAGAGTR